MRESRGGEFRFLSLSLSLFHARAWARFNFPGVSLPFFRTFFAYEYNSAGPWIFVAHRAMISFFLSLFCPTNWLSSDCRSKRDRCSNICLKAFRRTSAAVIREHLNYGLVCIFAFYTPHYYFYHNSTSSASNWFIIQKLFRATNAAIAGRFWCRKTQMTHV